MTGVARSMEHVQSPLTVDDLLILIGQLYVEKRLLEFQLSQMATPPPSDGEET